MKTKTRDKASRWPNGRGWDVTLGRKYFQVFHHGAIQRCVKDGSLTGFRGIEYAPPLATDALPDSEAGAIALVRAMIQADVWSPCV